MLLTHTICIMGILYYVAYHWESCMDYCLGIAMKLLVLYASDSLVNSSLLIYKSGALHYRQYHLNMPLCV